MILSSPTLLERDHSSITITWSLRGAEIDFDSMTFELQMSERDAGLDGEVQEQQWVTLSSSLTGRSVRKRHLNAGRLYFFRVRAVVSTAQQKQLSAWSPISDEMRVVSTEFKIMDAPSQTSQDGISVTLQWQAADVKCDGLLLEGYSLRFREENCSEWQTLPALVKGLTVRKKGLSPGVSYYFAVRPVVVLSNGTEAADNCSYSSASLWSFSLSSPPCRVAELSPTIRQLMPQSLTAAGVGNKFRDLTVQEALAGKVVLLYFSAHWCGPCRQFTPRLLSLYRQAKGQGKAMEVVFCSADHSSNECQDYFTQQMQAAWLLIPFDDERREGIMAQFRISGIPRLCVLSRSGKILEDNAVSHDLSMTAVDSWIAAA